MKNLFILPTDKPSRLIFNGVKFVNTIQTLPLDKEINCYPYDMYITSNEMPKLDEWGFNIENNVIFKSKGFTPDDYDKKNCRKIIMTTNLKLIEDGVQVINDEFLEWFVKNPSCEFVQVESELKCYDKNGFCVSICVYDTDYTKMMYYLIIPKEEPLYKLIKEYNGSKPLGSILKHSELDYCNWDEYYELISKEEPKQDCECTNECLGYLTKECKGIKECKQETLEEANFRVLGTREDTFYNGAKWQEQNSNKKYNEEDMKSFAEFAIAKFLNVDKVSIVNDYFKEYKK